MRSSLGSTSARPHEKGRSEPMDNVTGHGRRRTGAAARGIEGTSGAPGLSDEQFVTTALERGRVQVTFLVDPRFLEVAREQKAELGRSVGCELLISEQRLGQIVISGTPSQARIAVQKVRTAIRYRSRREQGRVRRNGGRLDLPMHPDPLRWHRHPAVVVLGSSCAPPHAGHVATLIEAWRRAEAEGYRVEAAYLVPARHTWLEEKVRRYARTQPWRVVRTTVLPEAVRVDMCSALCKDLNGRVQPHQWSTLWEPRVEEGAAQAADWMRTPAKVGASAVATVQEIERSRPDLYVWDATGMDVWTYEPMRPYRLDDGTTLSSSLIWRATVDGLAGLQAMVDEGALTASVGDMLWRFWSQRSEGEEQQHLFSLGAVLRMVTSVIRSVGGPCAADGAAASEDHRDRSGGDAADRSEVDGDAMAEEAASVRHASPPREEAEELSSLGRSEGSQLDDRQVTRHTVWSGGVPSTTRVLTEHMDVGGPGGSWQVDDERPGPFQLGDDEPSELMQEAEEGQPDSDTEEPPVPGEQREGARIRQGRPWKLQVQVRGDGGRRPRQVPTSMREVRWVRTMQGRPAGDCTGLRVECQPADSRGPAGLWGGQAATAGDRALVTEQVERGRRPHDDGGWGGRGAKRRASPTLDRPAGGGSPSQSAGIGNAKARRKAKRSTCSKVRGKREKYERGSGDNKRTRRRPRRGRMQTAAVREGASRWKAARMACCSLTSAASSPSDHCRT